MSGYSWSYEGEKRLDNFFEHFFIRNKLVPGYSASQGGNAAASHTRDVDTDLYLRRGTMQNPGIGVQEQPGMQLHKARAELSIAEVDALRRKEFHRRQEAAQIDERLKGDGYIEKVRRQVGWPFSAGLFPTVAELRETEDGDPLYPKKKMKDWERPWNGRDVLGHLKVADDPEAAEKDENFVPIVGPVGWEKGFLEIKGDEGEPGTESFRQGGWYWSGPEKRPAFLDVMLWKPLAGVPSAIIDAAQANKTEENIRLGRNLEEPEELRVKRSLNRQFKVKDLVHGGYKTLSFADHGGFYANVDVRDPVTGVSVYSYNQKRHTVTNDKGHGVVEKDKLLQRKVRKVNQLKEQSREHSQELETFHGEIAFFEEKYRSGKFPLIFARDKIQANLAKIAEVSRHKDLVDARLALEEREVKALETDLERSGIAEDLPLPRAVLLATPTPVLEGMRATKDALDDAGRAVGLVSEKGWKPGHGMAGGSIFDTLMEEFAGQRAQGFGDGETYFGQPLLDPVSGKANDKVVRRKNSDTKLRAHEYNKSVTDVMMARSDGTSRYERPSPQQRVEERAARREQQAVVDALVKTALEGGHAEGPLEAWAESENRKKSTFGSSEHPQATPVMTTLQVGDGTYLTMKTLTAEPQLLPGVEKPPAKAISWKCSSGKVVGGGKLKGSFELAGWGTEPIDNWISAGAAVRSAQGRGFTPNQTFCGRATKPGERGPYAPTIVEERPFNGKKSTRYREPPRKLQD